LGSEGGGAELAVGGKGVFARTAGFVQKSGGTVRLKGACFGFVRQRERGKNKTLFTTHYC